LTRAIAWLALINPTAVPGPRGACGCGIARASASPSRNVPNAAAAALLAVKSVGTSVCGTSTSRVRKSETSESQIVLPALLWADLTVNALRHQVYSTHQADKNTDSGADTPVRRVAGSRQPGGEVRPFPAISGASTRSVGVRMKTSHVMSGCCGLPLIKPNPRLVKPASKPTPWLR
jgi:hypothetical protein